MSGRRPSTALADAARFIAEPLERRTLLSLAPAGPEFRVNTFTTGDQGGQFDGLAIATDGDGDFVAVWQSAQDGSGTGVYAQRYDAAGTPRGAEFRVNTATANGQSNPAVAMDADGDFVVAWQSFSQDGLGGYGVYAQRFDAAGNAVGNEFRVNTYTTDYQWRPAVAMDVTGNFVVAWQSVGQDGSADGVYAQRYDWLGIPQGAEFRVNTYTTMIQGFASVAVAAGGDFVIAWESQGQDGSGYGVYARRYDAAGAPLGGEFRVNTFTTNRQSSPSVAVDLAGDFVVAYASYGQDGSDGGVYARRYDATGTALGAEFKVNTHTTGGQFIPVVATDADGDFLVAWSSYLQDGALSGVYAQQFDAAGSPIGGELRVNTHTTGDQAAPAVAADHKGDYVVTWRSGGQDGSGYGVYAQRYAESTDAAGPVVAGVFVNGARVLPYSVQQPPVQQIVVSFSENVANATSAANWLLTRNGVDIISEISSITFGLNATTNRYEAVLNLATPQTSGNFLVQARDTLQDAAGNALDGDFNGAPGGSFARPFSIAVTGLQGEFRVNTFTTNAQFAADVAVDGDGNFVVVWTGYGQDGNALQIYAQRYDATGAAQGGEFRVNEFTTLGGSDPSVAIDQDGDFVVAWWGYELENPTKGIRARRFNAAGVPQGNEFRVNTFVSGDQQYPDVAMDAFGNFVVAWQSDGQDVSSWAIVGKRFDASGVQQGGEFLVNTITTGPQANAAVARDADGDFVVTWRDYQADSGTNAVYAQRYNAAGVRQGGQFRVHAYTTGHQFTPAVAMDTSGNFVVAWAGAGAGDDEGISVRLFDAGGTPLGGDIMVNAYTTDLQRDPAVARDQDGDFTVVWSSSGQDGSLTGIFAQRYDRAGVRVGGEFRVNDLTTGVQREPAIAMAPGGDFVVAWDGAVLPGGSVRARRFVATDTPAVEFLVDSPDPVVAGNTIRLEVSGLVGPTAKVSYYRESNGVAGLQVGFEGDTLVGVATSPSTTGGFWAVNVPTTGLSGTHTYWAQATDFDDLIGRPASTTNTVTPGAPAVTASNFNFATLPQRLTFTFDQNVGSSLALDDIVVQQLPGGPTVTPSAVSFDGATNTATFTFNSAIPDGRYRARLIASGISGPGGQLPADHTFEFTFLRGDANGDGAVNLTDFNVLAANFGQSPRDFTQGDFDYSGTVNLNDFNLLAARFGMVVGPSGVAVRAGDERLPAAPGGAGPSGTGLIGGGMWDETDDEVELIA